ncbi:MAG: hypothetical protein OEW37_06655 [Rhodospirillaceae bacterium]|nr:hypothetical protein [Rhodospirillaceae bacterium]
MVNTAGANTAHKDELNKMLQSAIRDHGEGGDVVKFLRQQIADMDEVIAEDVVNADIAKKSIPVSIEDIVEKGKVLYVVIGMVMIFVLLGFSSLFFGMLATKWDSL